MFKKVRRKLDSSNASCPDCIPAVVLENSEAEPSYILAELFNICLKSLVFQIVRSSHQWRPTAKNYCPVGLLSVVSKIFEKLVNNKTADHLEKCGHFSDFQYGYRSFQSTAKLLTVASDRTAGFFNRFRATRALAIEISEAFDRVWHAGLLHRLKPYGISG